MGKESSTSRISAQDIAACQRRKRSPSKLHPIVEIGRLRRASLSLVSGAVSGHVKKRGALIAGLILSDVYMIVTGLVAGWTDDPTLKWWFYVLSCLAFVAIYGLLWGPFKELSLSSPQGALYRKKAAVLSIVWFAYPVVFLVGQEGFRLWSPVVDAVLFTVLDLTAKVAYGLWAVSLVQHTGAVEEELPESGDRLVRGR